MVALHEIAANLVDNALKYSAPGSPVDVDAELDDGSLVIRVRDEGQGIPHGDLGSSTASRRSTARPPARTAASASASTSSGS